MITAHRRKARAYKRELLERLFKGKKSARPRQWLSLGHYAPKHPNIVGIGFGHKHSKGNQITAPEAIRVYVRKKLPQDKVPRSQRIPAQINGMPTDVIEVGEAKFFAFAGCGLSAAHYQALPGTVGCRVQRIPDDGLDYILSNNHIFANADLGKAGDPILQPAAQDGGDNGSIVAHQSWRIALLLAGNLSDAALGEVITKGSVAPDIAGIGRVNPTSMTPVTHLSVMKSGRTTGLTVGVITETEADVQLSAHGTTYGFVEQIMVAGSAGPFASEGDSGSLIVDALQKQPVGLVFGGSATLTYVNPIQPILSKLQIQIL